MATNRRVGAESSKTRQAILDCVERLLLESGDTQASPTELSLLRRT